MDLVPWALLLCIVGAGALARGARTERRGALMFALAWLVALLTKSWPGPWLFLSDLAVMIGLVALSWKSPRPWPVYACGFQVLRLAVHVASWVHADLEPRAYQAMLAGLGFAAVATLAAGAWIRPAPRAVLKIK